MNPPPYRTVFAIALLVIPGVKCLGSEDKIAYFENRIRPVLVKHCYECHSGEKAKAGLRLDYRGGWQKGGDSGPALQAGQANSSLLIQAIRHQNQDLRMPDGGKKLSDEIIADFETWIQLGAVDPRDNPPSAVDAAAASWKMKLAERSRWWSLQAPVQSSPPEVNHEVWGKEPVDQFIYASLRKSSLSPARTATAEVLIRRLSFVLTGLPPKPDQVIAFRSSFQADPDAAMESIVEELLSSPHFGERFARHWMDVVRYTDTYGYEWDNPAKGSWEYRDYLIRAFNDDIGFDQLIREQIAGDLLAQPRLNQQDGLNESMIGPMFYHMGEHRHGTSLEFNGIHQEMVNNKIDAFSKAFLAMTVACARCHDHKLDAISQNDYYALAGLFMSPRWTSRIIDSPGKNDKAIVTLKDLRSDIRDKLAEAWMATQTDTKSSVKKLKEWAIANREAVKQSKLDSPAYPLSRVLDANDQNIETLWNGMSAEWMNTRKSRIAVNAQKFSSLTEFHRPGFPDHWIIEGDGMKHGYVNDGEPLISLEGDKLVDQLLPRGYHTHALSSKLPGAVRIPAQDQISGKFVSLKIRGGEWAGHLESPQNAFQSEAVRFFDPNATAQWISNADRELKHGVTRVLTEVATASLNPNFPPRTGKARAGKTSLPANDDGFNKRSWFSLTGIVTHDEGGIPQNTLDTFESLYTGKSPASLEEAWKKIAGWHWSALLRWTQGKAGTGEIALLNWMLDQQLLINSARKSPEISDLVLKYRSAEAAISFPRSANSMEERGLSPVNYRVNVRGDVYENGPAVDRNFLQVFEGDHGIGKSRGSGRLELANYLSSRKNPQTARVYVNRVWQWVFGSGLVTTPNDFGKLGGRPSHPELLDWLALQFMDEEWSTKKLVRRLVLSQAFRQSGETDPVAVERDPGNALLHHYPTRRLEAEAIRDSLLAVSGRLNPKLFGPPINPPRPAEDDKKRLFSGPVDSNGKRSLYLKMSIMEPPKFLTGFNLPDLKLPTGHRDVTNVPPQALILLNGDLATHLAEYWGEQLMKDQSGNPGQRLSKMFLIAFGRNANRSELERWSEALQNFSQEKDVMKDKEAWTEIAHALFNTKEFIYYR